MCFNPHSRFYLIDVLSAGTTCPKGIPTDVCRTYFNLYVVVYNGCTKHRGKDVILFPCALWGLTLTSR